MMNLKRISDMFDTYNKWIQNMTLTGTWATADNTAAVDARLRSFYDEKTFDRSFQHKTASDINAAVSAYINSITYELDGLYASTQESYNPIENYNLTEAGRDENRSSSSGDSTSYETSYDSDDENEVAKTSAGGTSSNTLIHSFTRSGNIGVTTTQQMLESERDIVKFDFIEYVCEKIIENFTMTEYFPVKDLFEVML